MVAKKVEPTIKAIADKQTKSQIYQMISEDTGLTVKQVKSVYQSGGRILIAHMKKNGSGDFSVPDMGIKVVRKTRPATKKREGRNPFTGETIMIPAKPKREVIRARPLKSLKDILA